MLNADSRANRVDPCGGVPLRLTDPSGSITSPGGGGQYLNDAYCKWLIEAPAGQVRTYESYRTRLEWRQMIQQYSVLELDVLMTM